MHERSTIAGVLMSGLSFAAAADMPLCFAAEYSLVVAEWLKDQDQSRLAQDADCRCDEDLRRERTESNGAWEAKPNYHPYYVSGDFNGDGAADFAVGIINSAAPDTFRVVIFNGPIEKGASPRAAYVSEPRPLSEALFYGPPRPTPYVLVVGAFKSHGMVLQPTANGYALKATDQ